MVNLTQYEDQLFAQGYTKIAGVDECGIGTLAGPVVAAAVILDPSKFPSLLALRLPSIKDSKKLSKQSRETLSPIIFQNCLEYAFGWVFPDEINKIMNIQQCGYLARFRALAQINPDYILSDHFDVPEIKIPSLGITKGDSKSLSIACASIIGKVNRDHFMQNLALDFPQYGWEKNFGYDVPGHREAIIQYGVTPHHKMYYGPIKEILNSKNYD